MNIRNTLITTTFLLLVASAASADRYVTQEKIRQVPNDPYGHVDVEIWTDRGDGAHYCAGDSIEIYFRTNVGAWVEIYDTDTRGRTHRLFPTRYARDNFVEGGRTYRVPARYGNHFEVEGPSGWETLRAVASTDRRALRDHPYDDRYRPYDHDYGRAPANYRTGPQSAPERIREVPDAPYPSEVAVAETRHRVRDNYRCRPPRPWWKRH